MNVLKRNGIAFDEGDGGGRGGRGEGGGGEEGDFWTS